MRLASSTDVLSRRGHMLHDTLSVYTGLAYREFWSPSTFACQFLPSPFHPFIFLRVWIQDGKIEECWTCEYFL